MKEMVQHSKRLLTRFLAGLVIIITSVVMVNAVTTLSVPNAVTVTFALPAGGVMAVAVPTIDRPILLMGSTHTVGDRGVGHVSLLRANDAPGFLMWTGLESQPSGLTQGFSATAGTHILYIDFAHQVDVQVHNATAIRVRNLSGGARTGRLTMVY